MGLSVPGIIFTFFRSNNPLLGEQRHPVGQSGSAFGVHTISFTYLTSFVIPSY